VFWDKAWLHRHQGNSIIKRLKKRKKDEREKQEGDHGHTGKSCNYSGSKDRPVQKTFIYSISLLLVGKIDFRAGG
jgi:hypothetical protein